MLLFMYFWREIHIYIHTEDNNRNVRCVPSFRLIYQRLLLPYPTQEIKGKYRPQTWYGVLRVTSTVPQHWQFKGQNKWCKFMYVRVDSGVFSTYCCCFSIKIWAQGYQAGASAALPHCDQDGSALHSFHANLAASMFSTSFGTKFLQQ